MDARKYLERIGIGEIPQPTAQSLARLQAAHLMHVPYENIDILCGVPIVLEKEKLYEKIVLRRRGGYCFELNELFGHLLRALGYGVTDLFGRFLKGEEGIPMRRHHVLLVEAPGESERFLCDVGVGSGSPTWPVRLVVGEEQQQEDGGLYRFAQDELLGYVLEERRHGQWGPIYSFTPEKQLPVDFVAASFYCEKSPQSIFNKEEMISLRRPGGGRITLDGSAFRVFSAEGVREEIVEDPVQKRRRIAEWFGIVYDEGKPEAGASV